MVVLTCNPSMQEAQERDYLLHSELQANKTLSIKANKKDKKKKKGRKREQRGRKRKKEGNVGTEGREWEQKEGTYFLRQQAQSIFITRST